MKTGKFHMVVRKATLNTCFLGNENYFANMCQGPQTEQLLLRKLILRETLIYQILKRRASDDALNGGLLRMTVIYGYGMGL